MNNTVLDHHAVRETVIQIKKFKNNHGIDALEDAIKNGAFHTHVDFGNVSSIIIHRDIDLDKCDIPEWITDIFTEYGMEKY